MKKIKIGLIDDHALVRQGCKLLLHRNADFEVCYEADSAEAAMIDLHHFQLDVIISDFSLSGMDGVKFCCELKAKDIHIPVIILSMHDNLEYISHAYLSGASGYLIKNCQKEELFEAIYTVIEKKKYFGKEINKEYLQQLSLEVHEIKSKFNNLTKRERELFYSIRDGKTTKVIAKNMDISVRTVDKHRSNILKKVGVNSVVELLKCFENYA